MHLVLSLNIHADGLTILRFIQLDAQIRFEQNDLVRLASVCKNVKTFELSNQTYLDSDTYRLNENARIYLSARQTLPDHKLCNLHGI